MGKYKSRAERFEEAQSKASDAKEEMEELRDELQNWLDGLSGTNLENSNKAQMLEEAISNLEDCISSLEEVEDASVDFPSMYS